MARAPATKPANRKPRRPRNAAVKPAPAPPARTPEPVAAARPVGRPSAYDPRYCEEIIENGREGYSVAAFAGKIGVSRQTLYNWSAEHPEFLDAKKIAEALCVRFWEMTLRKCAVTGKGNVTAAIFGLKNRARDDWADRVVNEHAGSVTVKEERSHAEIAGAIQGKLARIATEGAAGPISSQPDTRGA